MLQAGFHQMHDMANAIREEFSQTRSDLSTMANLLKDDQSRHTSPTTTSSLSDVSNIKDFDNNASDMNVQFEMLKLLKSMRTDLSNFCKTAAGTRNNATDKKTKVKKKRQISRILNAGR